MQWFLKKGLGQYKKCLLKKSPIYVTITLYSSCFPKFKFSNVLVNGETVYLSVIVASVRVRLCFLDM